MPEAPKHIRLGKRRSPRPPLERRVLVRTPGGQIIQTRSFDISTGGLRLTCDVATAYMLNFEDIDPRAGAGPVFEVKLTLPFRDGLVEFSAHAQLVHQQRRSPEDVSLGLAFCEASEAAREDLEAFLHELARAGAIAAAADESWLEHCPAP